MFQQNMNALGSKTPWNMIVGRYQLKKLKLNFNLINGSIEGGNNIPHKEFYEPTKEKKHKKGLIP